MRTHIKYIVLVLVLTCSASGSFAAVEYNSAGRRDPFVPLVGVSRVGGGGGVDMILTIEDVSLQGIIMDPDGTRSIIMNGEIVKEGQQIGQLIVEDVGNNLVKIKIGEERHTIKLYE